MLSAIDNTALGWLPVWARVILWAAFASYLSMAIYRLTSRQQALSDVKAKVVETRAELQGFEGEFDELWPILRRNLGLAGKQLGLTFIPAMIASFPVLFILAWMSNAFDAQAPVAGSTVPVTLATADGRTLPPGDLAGGWQGRGGGGGHLGCHLAGRRHLTAARGFRRQYTPDPAHGRTGAHGASA